MTRIVFQVIEGLEAGRIYRDLTTPLTIGREEDNDVQLNDERVSRFHAKVQSDGQKFILTDLDSTNGTRVNGHPIKMRVLRAGDLVMIGRCILLVGGDTQAVTSMSASMTARPIISDGGLSVSASSPAEDRLVEEAFPQGPPPAPKGLKGLHAAEVSDMLEFIRTELLQVIAMPTDDIPADDRLLRVQRAAWQRLGSLVPKISVYLNSLADPVKE